MVAIPTVRPAQTDQLTPWCIVAGLTLAVVWAYWNTIMNLVGAWASPQYSHGFLVPVFTAVLLSMRREPFRPVPSKERWLGVGLIVLGLAIRLFASARFIVTVDMISIIPVLAGVFLVAGGWSALRWSAAPLAFLIFMVPLPTDAANKLLNPLQNIATGMSTYTLQTIGVDTHRDGNRIILGSDFPLNVEEQCSGLRMGTIFLAMAVAMTMIIDRPLWQKAFIIVSAIPIALVVNMIRIVTTALMYLVLGPDSEFARTFFHDLAGWFMMPIALGFMYLEMLILDRLFIEESSAPPQVRGFAPVPGVRRATPAPAPTRSR